MSDGVWVLARALPSVAVRDGAERGGKPEPRQESSCMSREGVCIDLQTVGALESFIRREGGSVRFALGKPRLAAAEWRLAGLEKVNLKIKLLSWGL